MTVSLNYRKYAVLAKKFVLRSMGFCILMSHKIATPVQEKPFILGRLNGYLEVQKNRRYVRCEPMLKQIKTCSNGILILAKITDK